MKADFCFIVKLVVSVVACLKIMNTIFFCWLSVISLLHATTGVPDNIRSYHCSDGAKVYKYQICDGINNCVDHTDEDNCKPHDTFNGHFSIDVVSKTGGQ